jgi:uncharacterized protein (TIRG00374 family)
LFLKIISGYNLVAIFVAVLLLFSGFFALAGRLSSLSNGEIKISHSVIGTIIGQGSNNILPAKLGEVVKVLYISKHTSQKASWVFGLVFWERFFDLNILLICGLLIFFSVMPELQFGYFIALIIVIWLVLFSIKIWPFVITKIVNLIPFRKLRGFILELFEHLGRGLSWSVFLKALTWTLIIWIQYIAQVAVVLLWAASLELPLTAVLVIFVVSGIGLNLAASPGGIGVYEAAIVVSASWYGVAKEEALAAAIVLHVVQYAPTTLLAFYFMFRNGMSLSVIKAQLKNNN